MTEFLNNLFFIFQRLDWLSVVDILLVTLISFGLLYWLRDTQALVLLRGVILLVVLIVVFTSLVDLPAFSWLVRNALPALLLAVPVVFAQEIRRALERIGRAGTLWAGTNRSAGQALGETIGAVVEAAARLSARQHGALIVIQRLDSLESYMESGVRLNARVTPELLLQIFFPNTPLHDGAVICTDGRLMAAACVLPLSASGILNRTPERQMGLRHRAALGISEASDAVAVVVAEESGAVSVAHSGRLLRRLDLERLRNVLTAFLQPGSQVPNVGIWGRLLRFALPRRKEG